MFKFKVKEFLRQQTTEIKDLKKLTIPSHENSYLLLILPVNFTIMLLCFIY